ncbi:MAG: hypothetical protein GX950_02255 [Candidatus Diapherotrites archaeon]|uniref:Uncharacterized protein n=1 Tax=Candidatus Iainarchaeum sp. TaxID=3101447 RepID=A0A7K4BZC6_9ARCH|nr:hypothetical protein [Candidatus Diapherotrites archaeon]
MNYKKYLVFGLVILLLCPQFFAMYTSEDITWNGFVEIFFDNETFDSSSEITGSIFVNNIEDYPIIGGRLVLQVVEINPNQSNDSLKENIVYETSVDNIWIIPVYGKKIEFKLPKLSGGNYRLDTYFWVLKSKMVGSSAILYNPISKNFSVKGPEKSKVVILRDKTYFGNNVKDQVGFPAIGGKEFSGKIFIKNESSKEKKDLSLIVTICDWASAFCNEEIITKEIKINNILANEEKEIDVSLIAPKIPSAYEINLKLVGDGSIESIYKNRVIVTGPTAKLRKIFMTGIENENYGFTATFTGSPDHFTYPVFENFEIKFELYNLNKKLEEKSETINKLSTTELDSKYFKVDSKEFDKACVLITKENIVYEKECFEINLKELKNSYESVYPTLVDVEWNYNEDNEVLEIVLKKDLINAKIILLSEDRTIFEKKVVGKVNKYSTTFSTPKRTILLLVDDLDALIQQSFTLSLDPKVDLTKSVADDFSQEKTICSGSMCPNGYICSGQTYNTDEGVCCPTECIKQTEYDSQESLIPNILFVSIIFLVIAIFVAFSTFKKVKK